MAQGDPALAAKAKLQAIRSEAQAALDASLKPKSRVPASVSDSLSRIVSSATSALRDVEQFIAVTPVAAPAIVRQPASQTITSGLRAFMSVGATGAATLAYQWYEGSSGTTTTPVAGATTAAFTTPALTVTTNYWVRVSNGSGTVDSATAVITVSGGGGCTVTLADSEQATVASAISTYASGSTICLPAGTSTTWTSGVSISGKALTIKGAGGGKIEGFSYSSHNVTTGSKTFVTTSGLDWTAGEVIRVVAPRTEQTMTGTVTSYSGTSLVVEITSVVGTGTGLAMWAFEQDGLTRITFQSTGTMFDVTKQSGTSTVIAEFDITRGTLSSVCPNALMKWGGEGEPFIAHDMRIENKDGQDCVFYGTSNGSLIYKVDAFTDYGWPSGLGPDSFRTGGYVKVQMGTAPYQGSWLEDDFAGTKDTTGKKNNYVEQNDIIGFATEALDCSDQCRMVWRYNRQLMSGLSSHGPDSGQGGGLRYLEIYNNLMKFTVNDSSCTNTLNMDYWINQRGGPSVIADNEIDDIGPGSCYAKTAIKFLLQGPWFNGGSLGCSTTSYPFPHQHGQSHNGTTTYTEMNYIWGNTGTASQTPALQQYTPDTCTPPNTNTISFYLQLDRDYKVGTTKPSYTKYPYPHNLRPS